MTRALTAAALLTVAGSATAQDLLFVSDFTDGSADEVNRLNVGDGSVDNLLTFAAGNQDTIRYGGLTIGSNGFNGEFYIQNSPLPTLEPSSAEIFRIDGLLSGAPAVSSFAAGNPVQNVTGMEVDPFTGSLLVSNNPGSGQGVPQTNEGLLSLDLANSSNSNLLVPATAAGPQPRFQAFGGGLISGRQTGEFFFGTLNGGTELDGTVSPGDSAASSTIGRIQFNDAGDPTDNTTELIFDGATTFTGLSDTLSLIRGIDLLPNGNLVVSEIRSQGIYEIALDGNGDFVGITQIWDRDGSDLNPQGVIYNQFTGQLNFIERDQVTGLDQIVAINLDGTGFEVLGSGLERTGSLIAIPAPGSLALLGLGGLAAARRRR